MDAVGDLTINISILAKILLQEVAPVANGRFDTTVCQIPWYDPQTVHYIDV